MPSFEALAPVRAWDIEVTVGAATLTLPAASAADWAAAIIDDDAAAGLLGMAEPEAADAVEDALFDGAVTWFEMEHAFHDAVAALSGVRWWEAQRLLSAAFDWEGVGGELLLRGVRLDEVTVAQACALVWRMLIRGIDDKDKAKLTAEIEKPPPGVDFEREFDEAANERAFAAIPSA